MRAQSRGLARVFEDTKVDRLLVRLNAPRDGMVGVDINPTYKVGLKGISHGHQNLGVDTYHTLL
jgi:hypothetical protein